MASDHIPMFINIEPCRPQGGPKNVPKWIAKHPEFQRFLEAAIAEMSTELGPWQRLEQLKELLCSPRPRTCASTSGMEARQGLDDSPCFHMLLYAPVALLPFHVSVYPPGWP
eukprot:5850173-Pyramimonas_sp.AAC.1